MNMLEELFSDYDKQKSETWTFLKGELPGIELVKTKRLAIDHDTRQTDFEKNLALVQVANHYSNKTELFLSTEQLFGLAENNDVKLDIDDKVPCVYVFLSLSDKKCIKVGQSCNVNDRFVNGHFNVSKQNEPSHLSNYYVRDWPRSIDTYEVVAIIFPMYGSGEKDRLAVESGLVSYLGPEIP